ncbi:MAG TPA: hypothetical protein VJ728_04035 [Candidatus Binataceae bacterium]|nr:hypothetical protein [Candidatus Binataceae bacterium]
MKRPEADLQEELDSSEAYDLFEMANLFPATTGLPMTVWVSPRGNARHDIRVKVNMTHGNQIDPSNTAVVGVRPTPHMIAGTLKPDEQRAVFEWVSLNTRALIEYWEGDIDTIQLGHLFGAITRIQTIVIDQFFSDFSRAWVPR